MIPLPVAPLTGVTVLVTRPEPQTQSLCTRITALGGEAIAFPSIAIEPKPIAVPSGSFDWLIFVSAHAVAYGFAHVTLGEHTRIAAIGQATARELSAHQVRVDAVPEENFTSETLLAHPAFLDIANKSVLIVKGEGGRELLREALCARGARVTTLDVYRRTRPAVDAERIAWLEEVWRDGAIHIMTLTSVETLENLMAMLSEDGRGMLRRTPYVTLSERIAAAARAHGLQGTQLLARSADDAAIVGAIAAWHARAR